MKQISDYEAKAIEKLSKTIEEGSWSNNGLVQLIELAGNYLNLQTLSTYSKNFKISYNGAKARCASSKNNIQQVSIFKVKFVIDNE